MRSRDAAVATVGLLIALPGCGRDRPRPATDQPSTQETVPEMQPSPGVPPGEVAAAARPAAPIDDRWGVVPLAGGTEFQTTLYDLSVIGQLRTIRKQPYYVLAGRRCEGCDANLSLYVHSPSDGPMGVESEQPRFPYPGREVFYEDSTPLYEARTFFGDCSAAHPNAVIWFQRRIDVDGRWLATVRIAQVVGDSLTTALLETGGPALDEVEDAVARGRCREIPGRDRTSEP